MGYTGENKGVTGPSAGRQQPRLLDEVRRCLRLKHYSLRTEQAYVAWIRRFILESGKRHPREMGGLEVERFLTGLAVEGRVSAGTQNQALSALLFLYRQVLAVDLPQYCSLKCRHTCSMFVIPESRNPLDVGPKSQHQNGPQLSLG